MLEIGYITRSHGLRGELVVHLVTTETVARSHPVSTLFAGERPLVVRTSRPHQKSWVVGFEGVDTREAADELRGIDLVRGALGCDDADDDDALWVHELIGARVVDADGVDRGQHRGRAGEPGE